MYNVVVKKVHVCYLISWWVSCLLCVYIALDSVNPTQIRAYCTSIMYELSLCNQYYMHKLIGDVECSVEDSCESADERNSRHVRHVHVTASWPGRHEGLLSWTPVCTVDRINNVQDVVFSICETWLKNFWVLRLFVQTRVAYGPKYS